MQPLDKSEYTAYYGDIPMYHMGHDKSLSGERVGVIDEPQGSSALKLLKATAQTYVARDLTIDQKQGIVDRTFYGHYALFTNDIGKQAWLFIGNPDTLKISKDFKTARAVTTRRAFSAPVDNNINFVTYTPQAFGPISKAAIALGMSPYIAEYDTDLRDFLYRPENEVSPSAPVQTQGNVVPFQRPRKAQGQISIDYKPPAN